jgi:small conductance mechanosensitive channel
VLTAATQSPTSSPSPTVTGLREVAAQQCESASSLCRLVQDATGSATAGQWVQLVVGTPLQIMLILLVGFVLRYVLHRSIDRVAERIASGRSGLGRLDERLPSAGAMFSTSPLLSARREQRARTTASVLASITTGVVTTVVLLMVLQALGVSIAPLLASAGIVGLAVGFGAQALVKDFLSGIFMIIEDQYGVGDLVDLGEASGVVEAVSLRVTRLRDTDGAVWYVRNGEVLRVGNRSQGGGVTAADAPGSGVPEADRSVSDGPAAAQTPR